MHPLLHAEQAGAAGRRGVSGEHLRAPQEVRVVPQGGAGHGRGGQERADHLLPQHQQGLLRRVRPSRRLPASDGLRSRGARAGHEDVVDQSVREHGRTDRAGLHGEPSARGRSLLSALHRGEDRHPGLAAAPRGEAGGRAVEAAGHYLQPGGRIAVHLLQGRAAEEGRRGRQAARRGARFPVLRGDAAADGYRDGAGKRIPAEGRNVPRADDDSAAGERDR